MRRERTRGEHNCTKTLSLEIPQSQCNQSFSTSTSNLHSFLPPTHFLVITFSQRSPHTAAPPLKPDPDSSQTWFSSIIPHFAQQKFSERTETWPDQLLSLFILKSDKNSIVNPNFLDAALRFVTHNLLNIRSSRENMHHQLG